jgi:sialic acid synthase SpsE
MKLGTYDLTREALPYIIAEVGVNHEGSFEKALHLIDLAKEGGANGVKFQTYKAEKITSKYSPAYWDTTKESTKSQFELFKKYDGFGQAEYEKLAAYCREKRIDFLSTPFDDDAAEFLDPLVPFHKIASADITNLPLIRRLARKNKPILLSTGASNTTEIDWALRVLRSEGVKDIVLLHCVLSYPCNFENANLNMIDDLRRLFPDVTLGYSDHTPPDADMLVNVAAWIKGAMVIEKHFTFDKTLPGNDHYHAMDVHDLRELRRKLAFTNTLLGAKQKHPLESEAQARIHARRSIVALRDLKPGDVISEANITYKRPGHGISPMFWDEVLGKKVTKEIPEDKPLQWNQLD